MEKKYFAFISYKSEDVEWAVWLQHELEHYHLPASFNGRDDIRKDLRPVFRDLDELSAGNLPEQIHEALVNSQNLIVVCSPESAKSPWVNQEIETFISLGRTDCIYPFIVDGSSPADFFPKALLELSKNQERLGGEVSKNGRDAAFVKVVAGMLKLSFPSLWNRYEREKAEQERIAREQRDRLLLLESRYLSEKALDIASVDSQLAKKLVLRALPKDLNDLEERPYCIEAESALRTICNYKSAIFPNYAACTDYFEKIGLPFKEKLRKHIDAAYCQPDEIIITSCLTNDGKQLLILCRDTAYENCKIKIWNIEEDCLSHQLAVPSSNDIAIDKEARWFALACLDFSIIVYDLKELTKIKEIPHAHFESLSSIDFSPDGNKLLSASFDGKFKVWNWMNSEAELMIDCGKIQGAYASVIYSAKYSNDGKFIVTTSQDCRIRIWDAITCKTIRELLVDDANPMISAYFNHDSSCIIAASGDDSIHVWDIKPQVPYKIIGRARYIPFEEPHTQSALSPDGKLLLKIMDNTITVFDAKTNIQLGSSLTFFDDFDFAMFTKDGRFIIAETKRDYDVSYEWTPLQELIDRTTALVANHPFSLEERKKYYLD
jgi:hypothetical protein